jgi:3-hydroxyisobutyrate dehydrogenase
VPARSCHRGRRPKLNRIAHGEFSAQFAPSLALKDVHSALQAADDGWFTALECLAEEWQRAVDRGFGDEDLTAVTHVLHPWRTTP